jgi:hypothetical protein
MTKTIVAETTYQLTIRVNQAGSELGAVTFEATSPFAPIHKGDALTIGGFESFDSMLTARVEDVRHHMRQGDDPNQLVHGVTVKAVTDRE